MTIEKTIAENLRAIRLKRKLTQEAVAFRSSIQPNYYACVERGTKMLSIPALVKIAKALGVKPSLLLEPEAWRQVKNEGSPKEA